ncbi:MAG: outer membrane protein [Mucilaginibacter sp.]|nr:outer membrane protein [Mucilaginibacter sp.]
MRTITTIAVLLFSFGAGSVKAQDSTRRVLKVEELFTLAAQNSKALNISKQGIDASHQSTEIAKSERLPEISASIDAGYISNITVLNPTFSYNQTVPVPHFSNNYGVDASETLYNGNRVNNNIAKAKLEEQLSVQNYNQDKESIKMLLLSQYLELYRLFNQRRVYEKNIELAKTRLKNIQALHTEGMVTKNDIIRSQLQITDLDVLADQVNNNIAIINKELTVVLGLPAGTQIAVDTTITASELKSNTYAEYLRQAYALRPAMKATQASEGIAEKNIRIAKAEKLPAVSLYAGDGFTRPYMYSFPPMNIYSNIYQAGIRLRYNISSLYHAKDHIRLAEIRWSQQRTRSEQVQQQAELDVNSAFIKYNEAKTEFDRREKARLLADDNYRIVEKKYLNQMAMLTDILDASSAKLAAELTESNAGINIVYRWYLLQKATGNF